MCVDYRRCERLEEGLAVQVLLSAYELTGVEGKSCKVGRLGTKSSSGEHVQEGLHLSRASHSCLEEMVMLGGLVSLLLSLQQRKVAKPRIINGKLPITTARDCSGPVQEPSLGPGPVSSAS